MKSTRRRELRRCGRCSCAAATSGVFGSMESVEAVTEAAEPGQQSVFESVREFNEFFAGENFVDVFEDFHKIHRETFERFGADFVAVREHFNRRRNEA